MVQHGKRATVNKHSCSSYLARVEGRIQSLLLQRVLEAAESILDLALKLVGLTV
jgi:hypothetical protein